MDLIERIRNKVGLILLIAFLAMFIAYVAGYIFNQWQYEGQNSSASVTHNANTVFWENGWKKVLFDSPDRAEFDKAYTQDRALLKNYYQKFYYNEPAYKNQNRQQLDKLVSNSVETAFKERKKSIDIQLANAGYGQSGLPENFISRITTATLLPLFVIAILGFFLRAPLRDFRPFKKKESIHGDAKWASESDIRKANLRSKKGMLLGKNRNGFLIADGYQHALLFAPTGSGKGVGFVIPNLLFWEESVFVHDIKLENYELTSGWRKNHMKQDVFVWAPADPDGITHCYNPLDWISSKPGQMVDDVQKIANLILPEQEFWTNEARSLFVGVSLYAIADENKVNSFGEIVRILRGDDVAYSFAVILDTMADKIHPVSYMNLAAFLQKADKERSGVISTLNSALELWANPIIDTATATSDFNIMNIKKKPTTIYVGLTPDNIARLKPLMQVFYQQATEFLSRKVPEDDEPHGVMFMMDEFPTLGEMEQFYSGIAYFRGYNVRLFLIVQDTQQLKGIYEESGMNSFLSNASYRITFAANNIDTANLISQIIGNKTVDQYSYNKPKFFNLDPNSRSVHQSETQRALLLPQEVIGLPRDEQILLIESSPPIRTKKIFYFKERFFTSRLKPKIDIPRQEPYDARKVEAERKKKEEAEKAAKAAANPASNMPPASKPKPPPPPPPPPPTNTGGSPNAAGKPNTTQPNNSNANGGNINKNQHSNNQAVNTTNKGGNHNNSRPNNQNNNSNNKVSNQGNNGGNSGTNNANNNNNGSNNGNKNS